MILSLSGGLDSSSLLFEYKDKIKLAVSFKYGANHEKRELKAAKKVAKKAGVPHKIIDLTKTFKNFRSSLLDGPDSVPDSEYNHKSVSQLIVPFRNGIFLSILAGLADSIGAKKIALASHANDSETYLDCRPDFSNALAKAIKLGTTNNVEFFRPYILISKKTIAKRGIKAGLNPDWTYSCYKGGKKPCGKCPTCIERNNALKGLKWRDK